MDFVEVTRNDTLNYGLPLTSSFPLYVVQQFHE